MYLAADVLLVTPFRDGMNLVAKEYVAIRTDDGGRLVLSEFAGAAAELRGAFLVNPHDLEGMKEAIRAAIDASPAAARARMRRMRRGVARRDVHAWAGDFLAALARDVGATRSSMRSATVSTIRLGRKANRSTSLNVVTPDRTRIVSSPASTPARMSVSMRSPTSAVRAECAPIVSRPSRIMSGLGLPIT